MDLDQLEALCLALLQLRLANLELAIDTRYFTLLLVEDVRELLLELALGFFLVLQHLLLERFLFFVDVLDLLVEHLNVQLELLLNLDMVTNVSFILLQLLLVFFGWKFD